MSQCKVNKFTIQYIDQFKTQLNSVFNTFSFKTIHLLSMFKAEVKVNDCI